MDCLCVCALVPPPPQLLPSALLVLLLVLLRRPRGILFARACHAFPRSHVPFGPCRRTSSRCRLSISPPPAPSLFHCRDDNGNDDDIDDDALCLQAKEQFQDFLTEVEEKELLEDKAHEFAEQQNRTLKDVIHAHLLPVESMVQTIFKARSYVFFLIPHSLFLIPYSANLDST
jgi:hypothetical protein